MNEKTIKECGQHIVAPVLMDFTMWVLERARDMGISTLYFLARDGYPLYHIARRACEKYGIALDCRYLYCSRKALHLPAYQFHYGEACDHIFTENTHCTVKSILSRINITDEQMALVLKELQIKQGHIEKKLKVSDIAKLKEKALNSAVFREMVMENSREAYEMTIGYLRQEGLFQQEQVALVDSGWSGTSQRAIQRLLSESGFQGCVRGFYFGMYADPTEGDGISAEAWYFTKRRKLWNKVLFSPNLFECMLSAPDSMTIGYRYMDGAYVPVKKDMPPAEQNRIKEEHTNAILEGCETYKKNPVASLMARVRFQRLMTFPNEKEARGYGMFQFSDDIAGESNVPLCGGKDTSCIEDYTVLRYLKNRLLGQRGSGKPYWIYGAVSLVPNRLKRMWLRLNAITLQMGVWIKDTLG